MGQPPMHGGCHPGSWTSLAGLNAAFPCRAPEKLCVSALLTTPLPLPCRGPSCSSRGGVLPSLRRVVSCGRHCRGGRRRLSHPGEEFGQIPGDQQHRVNSHQGSRLGWAPAPLAAPSPLTQPGEDLAPYTLVGGS